MGRPIDSLMELHGMAWYMTRESIGSRRNIDATVELYLNRVQYRGVADESVYKNESTLRLTSNFPKSVMLVADSLRKINQIDSSIAIMKKAIEKVPYSKESIEYLAAIYQQYGYVDNLRELVSSNTYADPLLRKGADFASEGEVILWEVVRSDPKYKLPFDELLRYYYDTRQREKFRQIVEHWLQYNPDDTQMKTIYNTIDQVFDRAASNTEEK